MKTLLTSLALSLTILAAPAYAAPADDFASVCASHAVKSEKLLAACAANELPAILKDGTRFKATGIGAEVNTLAANIAFFVPVTDETGN